VFVGVAPAKGATFVREFHLPVTGTVRQYATISALDLLRRI